MKRIILKITALFLLSAIFVGAAGSIDESSMDAKVTLNNIQVSRKPSLFPEIFFSTFEKMNEQVKMRWASTNQFSLQNIEKIETQQKAISFEPTTEKDTKVGNTSSLRDLGNFKLTFYCGGSCCNGKWAGQTCTGNPMIEGRTIAVDKTVIPLGSDVYIEGFGWFVAEDVGGGIRGNHIDIYLEEHDRVNEMGIQSAEVYIK